LDGRCARARLPSKWEARQRCARWSPVTAVVAVWAAWKAPGNKCTTAHDVSPPGA